MTNLIRQAQAAVGDNMSVSSAPQHKNLSESLTQTLVRSDLAEVGTELAEVPIDLLIKKEVLREIPIVKTLVGVWKVGVTVQDWYFVQKLAAFLSNLEKIPDEKRASMLELLADSAEQEHVGEKLVGLLSRFDSSAKAKLLARAFSAYVKGKISADDFWRVSFIIDRLPMSDILAICEWKSKDLNKIEHVRKHLYLSVGLGWFVLNASSTGFQWEEKLCTIITDLLTPEKSAVG